MCGGSSKVKVANKDKLIPIVSVYINCFVLLVGIKIIFLSLLYIIKTIEGINVNILFDPA